MRLIKFPAPLFILCLVVFGCSKSSPGGTANLNNTWVLTHTEGNITVNGNILGVSQSNSTSGTISVSFLSSGYFNFNAAGVADETEGFTLSDSMIHLAIDSSYFGNICAYPQMYFSTTPIPVPSLPKNHVSPDLMIQYITRDSLLLKTEFIRAGQNGAPDTIFQEFSGFRRG